MFPYGWQLPDGSVVREAQFSGMVAVANSSYWRWVNPDVQNAFLRQCARRLDPWAPCTVSSHLMTVSSTFRSSTVPVTSCQHRLGHVSASGVSYRHRALVMRCARAHQVEGAVIAAATLESARLHSHAGEISAVVIATAGACTRTSQSFETDQSIGTRCCTGSIRQGPEGRLLNTSLVLGVHLLAVTKSVCVRTQLRSTALALWVGSSDEPEADASCAACADG